MFWHISTIGNISGIDLVHDQAEQALLKEIESLRKCEERLSNLHQRVVEQVYTAHGGKPYMTINKYKMNF